MKRDSNHPLPCGEREVSLFCRCTVEDSGTQNVLRSLKGHRVALSQYSFSSCFVFAHCTRDSCSLGSLEDEEGQQVKLCVHNARVSYSQADLSVAMVTSVSSLVCQ